MPEVAIRPALSSDLPALLEIIPAYQTARVWQMDRTYEEGQYLIHFREIRLPRPVKVEYPRSQPQLFGERWLEQGCVLVAVLGGELVGFARVSMDFSPQTVWLQDLVVKEKVRRQGIGTALLVATQDWGAERGARRMTVEMQSKNFPAIQLVRKLGFELSGYSDQYYWNQDIALFFTTWIR